MGCLKLDIQEHYRPTMKVVHGDRKVAQRWLSVDPLAHIYPGISPYAYVANNPINAIDPDGRRIKFINSKSATSFFNSIATAYNGTVARSFESLQTNVSVGTAGTFKQFNKALKRSLKQDGVSKSERKSILGNTEGLFNAFTSENTVNVDIIPDPANLTDEQKEFYGIDGTTGIDTENGYRIDATGEGGEQIKVDISGMDRSKSANGFVHSEEQQLVIGSTEKKNANSAEAKEIINTVIQVNDKANENP